MSDTLIGAPLQWILQPRQCPDRESVRAQPTEPHWPVVLFVKDSVGVRVVILGEETILGSFSDPWGPAQLLLPLCSRSNQYFTIAFLVYLSLACSR